MSSEVTKPKKSFGSNVISLAQFPVGMAAISGAKSIIRNNGIKNAMASINKAGFKALQGSLGGDCFSRGLTLANNYDQYSSLAKEAKKLENLINKDKIPFIDRIKNLFRKVFFKDKVVTTDTLKSRLNTLTNQAKTGALDEAKEKLANVKQLATNAGEALKTGFGQNVGSLIKKGLKDPFVWVFTALEAIPDIIQKIIPTFKKKGFTAGMKEVGKTALKTAGNVGTYVASSAVGRVIGTAIGTIFCPGAGSAVGGNIGSMMAVSLGNIIKGKIFKPKEETQVAQQTQAPLANKSFTA